MFFSQQHQILGRTYQKLIVPRRTLQSSPGVGTENTKLGFDLRKQPLGAFIVIGSDLIQVAKEYLLICELPDGFAILNQSAVIHS